MSQRVAWITGAGGLIGSHLVQSAAYYAPGWQIRALTRSELELTDFPAVRARWQQDTPGLVIHCAALTRTPICEQQPKLARQLNVEVSACLSLLAEDIPFIQLSTDLVFDGQKGHYVETDPVNPLTVYGETKVLAEEAILANPRHAIIRTSLNAGRSPTGDRSFTEDTRRAWQAGRTVTLFTDEYRCPIAAPVTARAIWSFAARYQPGLFHLAGSERLSRWEIGQLLAEAAPDCQPKIQAASLRDFSGPPRAPDTSLVCHKLQSCLDFPLPRFRDWLREHPTEAF